MLLTSIAEIAREPLVLEPADRRAEQETNTWWLGMAEADRALSVAAVVDAFERTADAIGARIRAAGFRGVATFYVWHDPQAGQLRCSTGSVAADALPFRAAYAVCEDLGPVVEAFLADRDPGVIGWADLAEARGGGEGATAARSAVWVRGVGTAP
ncbi:hypothetical protein AB0M32_44430 [Streptomyces sp. NPDC051985]|uniref:hypothetical protein n=1 Tax=Streptomyces sp. NPDC051985 TaxID=3155807 RepID=UPI00344AB940